jgi:16S rRNA (adenine1518-N6/adenine1519-N6)-dimethyltransferase
MTGHRARKRFGQNFLQDQQLIAKIIQALNPKPGENLVEIGPGLGALTLPLLTAAQSLTVVELDRDLIPKLTQQCQSVGTLTVINQDVLNVNFTTLASTPHSLRLIGNLPYNISTPVIFHLLKYHPLIQDMHFMLQKEVVERMAAQPGNKTYGRLSIMVQWYCQVVPLFTVPPQAFLPQPKVDSMVVRLTPYRQQPHPCRDMACFSKIVGLAFSQRRKTLVNALKPLLPADAIIACGIDPKIRAEQLSLADFVRLSNHILE